jgi:hypothetical protein
MEINDDHELLELMVKDSALAEGIYIALAPTGRENLNQP